MWMMWFICLAILVVLILAAVYWPRNKNGGKKKGRCCRTPIITAYGEFIDPYALGTGPTVLAGDAIVFPVATIAPVNVSYVEEADRVGVVVPQGDYLVAWDFGLPTGAAVNLLVNGLDPLTATGIAPPLAYAQSIITPGANPHYLSEQYLVRAPLLENNLISFVNAGSTSFIMQPLPNTTVGSTAIVAHVRVQRMH